MRNNINVNKSAIRKAVTELSLQCSRVCSELCSLAMVLWDILTFFVRYRLLNASFNLWRRFLSAKESRFGLAAPHFLLAIHMYIELAYSAFKPLSRVAWKQKRRLNGSDWAVRGRKQRVQQGTNVNKISVRMCKEKYKKIGLETRIFYFRTN